ncbi:MAG: O-antigen ligase family protein [Mesorhizobium sp.]
MIVSKATRPPKQGNNWKLNRVFTFVCFALPPGAGSAVSFIFNGAALYSISNVVRGKLNISTIREIEVLTTLFLLYVCTAIFAAVVNGSAFSDPSELLGLATFAFFPFAYASWSVSNRRDVYSALVWGSAVACVTALILAVVQVYGLGFRRAEGGAGNALIFATILIISVSITLLGIFTGSKKNRLLLAIAAGCGAVAIGLSKSRAPIVVLGFNIIFLFFIFCPWRFRTKGWISALIALILIVSLLMLAEQNPLLTRRFGHLFNDWNRIQNYGDYNNSGGIRLAVWEIGFEMWKQAPWFGYGQHAAADRMSEQLSSIYGIRHTFSHFHNFALQTLVQSGLFNFTALMALIVYLFVLAWRATFAREQVYRRVGGGILLITLVAYMGTGLTNIMFGHDILDAVFMISVVPAVFLAFGCDEADSVLRAPCLNPNEEGGVLSES